MSFESELKSKFLKYGFELSDHQVGLFKDYYNLLLIWNEKFNLTAITLQSEVIIKHFLDSVLPLNNIKPDAKIIDIGTGAGFPGIPIKILRPDVQLYLVDSLRKRTLFLNEVVAALELDDVYVIHARAEDLAFKEMYREFFDYSVSRAVAKLNILLEYCSPFVSVGGQVIAYKSKQVQEELNDIKNALKVLNLKVDKKLSFAIDEIDSEREIVFIEKTGNTPKSYPRGQNKPKTSPL